MTTIKIVLDQKYESEKDNLDKFEDVYNKKKILLVDDSENSEKLLDEEKTPLDGHEVMKKFREINNFNTKVILLTKTNKYEYDDEYLKDGFTDYLIKSAKRNLILDKINKYL